MSWQGGQVPSLKMQSKGWNSKPKQAFAVSSNRRDTNAGTVSLLSLTPVGRGTDSGLFLARNVYLEPNKRSVIGDIFFSTNACLVYWSKTCLDRNLGSSGSSRGWFGLDAIYLTPNRKLWIGRCAQLKHSFLCCLSVLLFFSGKAMKCNYFLVNQYVKAI